MTNETKKKKKQAQVVEIRNTDVRTAVQGKTLPPMKEIVEQAVNKSIVENALIWEELAKL